MNSPILWTFDLDIVFSRAQKNHRTDPHPSVPMLAFRQAALPRRKSNFTMNLSRPGKIDQQKAHGLGVLNHYILYSQI